MRMVDHNAATETQTGIMRSNGDRIVSEPARAIDRNATASLSVVLMSSESASPIPAVSAIHETCVRLDAQVILVTQSILDSRTMRHMKELGVDVVQASVKSSRAEMCDMGMAQVRGHIVTVRDVTTVQRADFLQAFAAVVPLNAREVPARPRLGVVREREVQNSMVAGRRPHADQVLSREPSADLATRRLATAEMAATL